MNNNLIYVLVGLIGSLFAGYKYNLWSKAKLLLSLRKLGDSNETSDLVHDLKNLSDQLADVDKQREDLKAKYENEP